MIDRAIEVAHGYTLADLDTMARQACTHDRSLASDAATRYNTAWSAIAEALVTAPHWPRRETLIQAGWQAIYREVREMRHTFGMRDYGETRDVASAPRFVQFWYCPTYTFEDNLVEQIALPAILATLTDNEREAVVALAVHDDYRAAAAALGLKPSTLTVRLSSARRRFRRRWYAPDTAPPITGTDRRVKTHDKPAATSCGRGHEWTPENTRLRRRPGTGRRERVCRECERDRRRERAAAVQAA